jgi:hypothetical protein
MRQTYGCSLEDGGKDPEYPSMYNFSDYQKYLHFIGHEEEKLMVIWIGPTRNRKNSTTVSRRENGHTIPPTSFSYMNKNY